MKVLITTDLYEPQINGVVISVINLYSELKKLGVDVKILTLSSNRKSYNDGDVYYVSSFPVKVYPDVRASVAVVDPMIRKLINWGPDIIHTQCEFSTLNFAKIISVKCKCPIVHTYHTMYEYYVRYISKHERIGKKFLSVFIRNLLKGCDKIIAPTNKTKKSLEKFGLRNEIAVIPTGIDLSKYDVVISDEELLSLRKELGIAPSDFVIVCLGRVAYEKNIDELVSHFMNLTKGGNNNNIKLLIVGGGPYLDTLKEKYVRDDIIFTGMVKPTDVVRYYRIADVFSSCSQSETQGLTYVEAMANGLPLVCKYDDCLDDLLIPAQNGFFIKDKFDFSKHILEIMSNEELKNSLSYMAKETSEIYSKENFAHSVYNLYENIVSNYKYMPIPKRGIYEVRNMLKNYPRISKSKVNRLKTALEHRVSSIKNRDNK